MSVFGGIFARGAAAGEVTGEAHLQAMLDVEAALAAAQAELGLIPDRAARAIVEHARASEFDVEVLAEGATSTMQPVIPLVAALRERVGPETAPHVHWGATSQDVLDTATMLVARRALVGITGDATSAGEAARRLAREHARTPLLGRTLLQPAAPTTFGL
ncbi:MAG: lyase family protein, partial [Candidatus Dormibacteraceae bacterium]